MNRWDINSELLQWLTDHPTLIRFIQIDACPTTLSPTEHDHRKGDIEWHRQTLILRVSHMLEEFTDTIDGLEEMSVLKKPPLEVDVRAMKLFHRDRYLSGKICNLRRKDLQRAIQQTQTLLDVLRDPEVVPESVKFSVDLSLFKREMLKGGMKYLIMSEYQKVLRADLKRYETQTVTVERLQTILQDILDIVVLQVDKKTFYFPNTTEERRFEQWLFCSDMPVRDKIESTLSGFADEPRQMFPLRILELYAALVHVFGVCDRIRASCTIILLFRIVFARAYAENPGFFNKGEVTGLQEIGRKVPISFLDVPKENLPAHESDTSVYDVFRGDELFRRAAKHLEYAFLVTNPIDAIFEIHELLMYIRNIVSLNGKENGMIGFETTFGLYIGSMLSSDVPCFEGLAQYVCDFAPRDGLCPEFQFARTTTNAALDYCRILREKFA